MAILKVYLDVILFCAKNDLPLRGSSDDVLGSDKNCGMFLNLIELISRYNPRLRAHLTNHRKRAVSYLSHSTQDEFVELIGNAVREQIVKDINNAKYYSMLLDTTPDISRKEQLSEIIRYLHLENDKVTIRQSFIDFIHTSEKTGHGLADVICSKFEKDGIDISNCRGQGYDGGANMSGHKKGVRAHISRLNKYADFFTCSGHHMNRALYHAANVSVYMVNFFDTVQSIFIFFPHLLANGSWQSRNCQFL